MQITAFQKLSDRIYFLGNKESIIYLFGKNEEYALLGGGMATIAPLVEEQINELSIDVKKIKTHVILHSHFDHVGVVPYFKNKWPWMRIAASRPAQAILVKPKVIASIDFLNQMLFKERNFMQEAESMGLTPFTAINVDQVLEDGDILNIDGSKLKAITVPGHSSCSIALYSPEEKAMFASDAGGLPVLDAVFTVANSNFDDYIQNIGKMMEYDIDFFLPEHFSALTGSEAGSFLKKSLASAKETKLFLKSSLLKSNDIEISKKEVTEAFMKSMPDGFFPQYIVEIVVGQMLNYIKGQL